MSRRLEDVLQNEQISIDQLENILEEDDLFQLEEREKSVAEVFSQVDADGNGAISK